MQLVFSKRAGVEVQGFRWHRQLHRIWKSEIFKKSIGNVSQIRFFRFQLKMTHVEFEFVAKFLIEIKISSKAPKTKRKKPGEGVTKKENGMRVGGMEGG